MLSEEDKKLLNEKETILAVALYDDCAHLVFEFKKLKPGLNSFFIAECEIEIEYDVKFDDVDDNYYFRGDIKIIPALIEFPNHVIDFNQAEMGKNSLTVWRNNLINSHILNLFEVEITDEIKIGYEVAINPNYRNNLYFENLLKFENLNLPVEEFKFFSSLIENGLVKPVVDNNKEEVFISRIFISFPKYDY